MAALALFYVYTVCLYVCAPWACLVPARNQVPGTRTGVGFLGTDSWELSWGCWEPNLNPLEEQLSVLNAKPFHQPLALCLTICTVYNYPSPGTLRLLLSPAVESQNTTLSSLRKKSLKGNSNFAQLVQHLNKVNLTSIQGKLEFTVNRANRSHNLDKTSYSST